MPSTERATPVCGTSTSGENTRVPRQGRIRAPDTQRNSHRAASASLPHPHKTPDGTSPNSKAPTRPGYASRQNSEPPDQQPVCSHPSTMIPCIPSAQPEQSPSSEHPTPTTAPGPGATAQRMNSATPTPSTNSSTSSTYPTPKPHHTHRTPSSATHAARPPCPGPVIAKAIGPHDKTATPLVTEAGGTCIRISRSGTAITPGTAAPSPDWLPTWGANPSRPPAPSTSTSTGYATAPPGWPPATTTAWPSSAPPSVPSCLPEPPGATRSPTNCCRPRARLSPRAGSWHRNTAQTDRGPVGHLQVPRPHPGGASPLPSHDLVDHAERRERRASLCAGHLMRRTIGGALSRPWPGRVVTAPSSAPVRCGRDGRPRVTGPGARGSACAVRRGRRSRRRWRSARR